MVKLFAFEPGVEAKVSVIRKGAVSHSDPGSLTGIKQKSAVTGGGNIKL
jgi:hypothetical protein